MVKRDVDNGTLKLRSILIQALEFIHSRNGFLGLGDEERLSTCGVHILVTNVVEEEGADACSVDDERGGWQISQE